MQLYTAQGPSVVRDLVGSGKSVFLDLKYHDIPNTVASAVREAAQLGVCMLTVHAAGGAKMLSAAVESASSNPNLMILAVTVLTSLGDNDLEQIGMRGKAEENVLRMAELAASSGCQGIVASAREAPILRSRLGSSVAIVTPGVRPAGAAIGDQARIATPADAIRAGADYIVVGRPITHAADPAQAAGQILGEITQAS